jgi:pSer/pThr/pTyr-binding forkhead associated (FHA) protein
VTTFDQFEALVEHLVEGTFGKMFPPPPMRSAQPTGNAVDTHEMDATPASTPDARRWTLRLAERVFQLGEPVVRLGRALSNDIILDDRRVSRRHAQLRWRDRTYWLSDLDSSHGALVNGQPVPKGQEYPLADGDCIDLAGLVLTIGTNGDEPAKGAGQ